MLGVTTWKVLNTTEEGSDDVGANTIALAYRNAVEKVSCNLVAAVKA
jgi:hypothetical protein